MSLLEALMLVLKAKESRGMPGLKKMIILATLMWPIVSAAMVYAFITEVSGKIPPPQGMIKTYGYFDVQSIPQKGKQGGASIFHSNNGKKYIVGHQFGFKDMDKWIKKNPKELVYMEGFFLMNGKGPFYPVYVKPDSQKPLLVEKDAIAYLDHLRNLKEYLPLVYVFLVLFLFSSAIIFHAKKTSLK